jgi:hypothetical protein
MILSVAGDEDLVRPFLLTSTVIPVNYDGEYSYEYFSMLLPHEALRREMTRAESAVKAMNVNIHPWKAKRYNEWLKSFFLPIVHDHHVS